MRGAARQFLEVKVRSLSARARRLGQLSLRSVGIRKEDLPFIPTRAHFIAARRRLLAIDRDVALRLRRLREEIADEHVDPETVLSHVALVEREVDRARRAFALFFDVFSQRGTTFAPALAACDRIAEDCYTVVRRAVPGLLQGALLEPVTYLEHSMSPATFRRGVMLGRLLGEQNPFPLVRVPYEHLESPWGLGVFLHEVGHNLQADLRVWDENQHALRRRTLLVSGSPLLAAIWGRWHKEIFADLIALLLGGPASARAMQEFLAYPAARATSFNPLSVHPTPFVRGLLLAEMSRRMGFPDDASSIAGVWRELYGRHLPGRLPRVLVDTAQKIIPHVVDEVAFQPRRGLAQRALADAVPFTREDERTIRAAAPRIARGRVPPDLPARFVVSASRHAFEARLGDPKSIARTVVHDLSCRPARTAEVMSSAA